MALVNPVSAHAYTLIQSHFLASTLPASCCLSQLGFPGVMWDGRPPLLRRAEPLLAGCDGLLGVIGFTLKAPLRSRAEVLLWAPWYTRVGDDG